MGIINNINLKELELSIRKAVCTSLDIRLLQEQLEDVVNYIKANENYLKNGKISKEIYKENKIKLEKNKKSLVTKINSNITICIQDVKKAKNLIVVNKI